MSIEVRTTATPVVFNVKLSLTPAEPPLELNTEPRYQVNGRDYAPWGDDNNNDFPDKLDEAVKNCPVAEAGLQVLNDFTYGQGPFLYKKKLDNGKNEIIPVNDPEIEDWMANTEFDQYLLMAINDYWRYGNIFPRIMRSKDRKKIAKVRVLDAPHCRWKKQDKLGRIESLFYSAQWNGNHTTSGASADDKKANWAQEITRLDMWEAAKHFDNTKENSYVLPLRRFTSGNKYYHGQPWHAAYRNGWIEISAKVPLMKKYMFENMMTPKFHIEIDKNYWTLKFPNWTGLSPEAKQEIKSKTFKSIEEKLVGIANSGTTITSEMEFDGEMRGMRATLRITPIDNKMKDYSEAFLPDAQQADSVILGSMCVDSCLLGAAGVPGSKMGAGSGSDKREAMLLLTARLKPHHLPIAAPWYLAKKVNKWDKDTFLGFRTMELTTLDKNPTGVKKVTNE